MAEMIFGCPHCGQAVQCDTQYAGQTVACPYCQGGIIVPAEAPVAAEEPVVSDQPVISEPEPSSAEPSSSEPEVISEPSSPEPVASEPVSPEPSSPGPAVTPKPKQQPRLPQPGSKFGGKKPMIGGGKIMTKKSGITAGAIKSQTAPKPQPKPAPAAAESKPAEAASQEAAGEIPAKAKGWSWAAFIWGPIWAIGNKVWWGLLCILPGLGFIFQILLAAKGKKQAWEKGKWRDIDHFVKVQKRWVIIGLIWMLLNIVAVAALFIVGPGLALLSMRGVAIEQSMPVGPDVNEAMPGGQPVEEDTSVGPAIEEGAPSVDVTDPDTSVAPIEESTSVTPAVEEGAALAPVVSEDNAPDPVIDEGKPVVPASDGTYSENPTAPPSINIDAVDQ